MTQRFAFNTFKGVDITVCPVGFVWKVSPHAYAAELILKLDSEDPNFIAWVSLTGERSFNTTWGRMPRSGSAVVIPLDMQSLVVELPDNPRTVGNYETAGALIVTPEGKFIACRNVVDNQFNGFHYISLQDFTIHSSLPTPHGVFDKWRLTTADTNANDRANLISLGDWQ